jgi:hypothetical protein
MKRVATRIPGSLVCFALAAVPVATPAQDLEFTLRGGLDWSNNVFRGAIGEVDGTAAVVGFDVDGERTTGRFQYALDGNLDYFEYLDVDGVSGQEYGGLGARSSYQIVPDTFAWALDAAWGQTRTDLTQPFAVGNIENSYTAATGPTVTGQMGRSMELVGDARYEIARYGAQNLESDTVRGQLVLQRRASRQTLWGLGASYADVDYDESDDAPVSPDFERSEAFLRYQWYANRTSIEVDAGVAKAEGDTFEDDGPMVRAALSRELTPSFTGYVRYVEEYPTSQGAVYFDGRPGAGGPLEDGSLLAATPRTQQSATAGLRYQRPRTLIDLSYANRREDTIAIAAADREVSELRLEAERRTTPRSTLRVAALVSEDEFSGPTAASNGKIDSIEFSAGWTLNLSELIAVEAILRFRDWDGNAPLQEYDEVSAGVFVRYGLRALRELVPSAAE